MIAPASQSHFFPFQLLLGLTALRVFPIRLSNGQIHLVETDLATRGFIGWSHTRSYANLLSDNQLGANGSSWLIFQLASLRFDAGDSGDRIVVVRGANSSLWFAPDGQGGWMPAFTERDSLVHDDDTHLFTLTTAKGYRHVFYDNSSAYPLEMRGRLVSFTDPFGKTARFFYGDLARVVRVEQGDGRQLAVFDYQYHHDGPLLGLLRSVAFELNGRPVREAAYDYYDGTSSGGSVRDLAQVRIREYQAGGKGWAQISRSAYRYYKDGEPGGFEHGLKQEFSAKSCQRLATAGLDPVELDDVRASKYADKHFAYDEERRVVWEAIEGGSKIYTFSYHLNPSEPGFGQPNVWYSRTVETRPDGSTFTVYANRASGTLLTKLDDDQGGVWYRNTRYNSSGRRIYTAEPSAIASVSEPSGMSTSLSVNLKPDSGLLHVNVWYAATDPELGAVEGYLESTGIKEGDQGDYIELRRYTYDTHTVNGVNIHPRASEETFPEIGQPGNVTRYRRCWYDSEDEEKGFFGDITRYPGNEAEVNDLIVVEQWQNTWNEARQLILNTHWQRFEDAPDEQTGALQGPNDEQPKGRRSYTAQWYDGIGRGVASANYGTNGGSSSEERR